MENTNMTIERNVMIIAPSEELMQGILRGIEALDTEHKIGIIHGAAKNHLDDVELILAELASAIIIKTPDIAQEEHPTHKTVQYYDVLIPQDVQRGDRTQVIDYVKSHLGNIIDELLK